MFENVEESGGRYAIVAGNLASRAEPGFASLCLARGTCLKKCPRRILIPEVLEEFAEERKGPGFQDFVDSLRQTRHEKR